MNTKKTILTIITVIAVICLAGGFAVTHWFIGKGKEIVDEAKNEETTTEVATTEEIEVENDTINVDFIGTGSTAILLNNNNDEAEVAETVEEATTNASEVGSTPNDTTVITTANTTTETPKPAVAEETPKTTEAPAIQACQHNWKTVVDTEAYDEPVYEEKEVSEYVSVWSDGTVCDHNWTSAERKSWCIQHCVTCYPNCPNPDPQGRCAIYDNFSTVMTHTEKVQTGTKHHDAVTHQECTKCGATK